MRLIFTMLIFCTFLLKNSCQNYTQAVGIRGGLTSGITYRNMVSSSVSNEFILKMKRREINVTFLRVFYEPNNFGYSPKLVIYKGYGAHVGYRNSDRYNSIFGDIVFPRKEYLPFIGFDVILGLEYRIEEFPLIVGLDIKPFFEFSTRQIYRLYLPDIAFVLKYRF